LNVILKKDWAVEKLKSLDSSYKKELKEDAEDGNYRIAFFSFSFQYDGVFVKNL